MGTYLTWQIFGFETQCGVEIRAPWSWPALLTKVDLVLALLVVDARL